MQYLIFSQVNVTSQGHYEVESMFPSFKHNRLMKHIIIT